MLHALSSILRYECLFVLVCMHGLYSLESRLRHALCGSRSWDVRRRVRASQGGYSLLCPCTTRAYLHTRFAEMRFFSRSCTCFNFSRHVVSCFALSSYRQRYANLRLGQYMFAQVSDQYPSRWEQCKSLLVQYLSIPATRLRRSMNNSALACLLTAFV